MLVLNVKWTVTSADFFIVVVIGSGNPSVSGQKIFSLGVIWPHSTLQLFINLLWL